MISSMTAYSRKEARDDQGEIVWEIRSVNHRFLEPFVRLPEEFRALEPMVRERLSQRLGRGKVDCSLRFSASGDAAPMLKVNERVARQVLEAANQIDHLLHEAVPARTMDILRWPGVIETQERDFTSLQKRAAELLDQAIDELIDARQREGERLGELIRQRCELMRGYVEQVRVLMPKVIAGVRERLKQRLSEVKDELDEGRLEQEMVLLAQKLDVDEEMDRLSSHLDEMEAVLKRQEPVGRRLDFLMQELNREANTLVSKSSDVEATRIGVELKVLIEQMREQIQNIE
ncbi:MAG: YicC family protein [Sedimenticola sp.]|nr:MAG: YicC family protein [Sedimenticola sp.]